MRKLAALLLAVTLLPPALAFAQDAPATPTPASSGQPSQPTIALAAPDALNRAIDDLSASQFDQAVLESSVFILMNPTFASGYYIRGLAYANLNKLPEALADMNKALPLAQGPVMQASIYESRAEVYLNTERLPQAIDDLTNAIKLDPNGDYYRIRGLALMQQNDLPAALNDINEAIQLSQDNPSLFLLRASLYSTLGNQAEAAADYLTWIRSFDPQSTPLPQTDLAAGTSFSVDMAEAKVYLMPITAKAGQSIRVAAVNASGSVDPLLLILDAQGRPLVGNDDASPNTRNALIDKFQLPADGTYAVVIFHAGGGSDGQISVQIRAQ